MAEKEKGISGDEGPTEIKIFVRQDDLIISFPHPTAWIGLHKPEVEQLINILQQRLAELP